MAEEFFKKCLPKAGWMHFLADRGAELLRKEFLVVLAGTNLQHH